MGAGDDAATWAKLAVSAALGASVPGASVHPLPHGPIVR